MTTSSIVGHDWLGRPIYSFVAADGDDGDDGDDEDEDDDEEVEPEKAKDRKKPIPAKKAAKPKDSGGSGDDGDDDDDDDDDDATLTNAPTLKDLATVKRALRAERKNHRETMRKLNAREAGNAEEAVKRAAEEAAAEKYRPVLISSQARSAFVAAGLKSDNTDAGRARLRRATKLLDMDEIEVKEDGTIEGLDDQIEDIKDQFPEMFKSEDLDAGGDEVGSRRARRVPNGSNDSGNKKTPPEKNLNMTQKLRLAAEQSERGRRRSAS